MAPNSPTGATHRRETYRRCARFIAAGAALAVLLAAADPGAALAAALGLGASAGLQGPGPAAGKALHYGISHSSIPEVNPDDAMAASAVFVRQIGRASGICDDSVATLYPDTESMVRSVNGGAVELVGLSAMEYLGVESRFKADPFFLYVSAGEVTSEYVLLAGDGVKSVADLAGRRVAVFNPSNQRDLADTWLDVLLADAGVPGGSRALQSIKVIKKRSQASMALFFGQVDAAVEPRAAFETASEMNPQVGRKLRVLAKSAPLLSRVMCIRRSMEPDLRRRYLQTVISMHDTPQYRQSFVMMQVSRLVAFEPRYLDATRQLNERFLALKKVGQAR